MPYRTMSKPKKEFMIRARCLPTSSMIDGEYYGQGIGRYERQCARLEDPCPGVRSFGQPDERLLKRRYSF